MTGRIVALGDVLADIRPGFASGDDLTEGVFQIRMNNLTREGELLLDKRRRVSPLSQHVDRSLLQPGDVLFNATNSPDLVGKTALFSGCDEPVVFSNHFIRLRTRGHRLDPRFLTRWLQREFQRGYFRAKCKQWVNQATFSQDRLVEMQLPLPPIEEQRRIADVLDAADALRAKRRAALAKLDSLMQAIFIGMFGDLTSSTVETVRFGSLLQLPLRNGISPSKSGAVVGEVLTLSAVTGSAFEYTATKESTFMKAHAPERTVSIEDFLICRGNGNLSLVGRGKYPDRNMPDVAFPDTIIAARCNPRMVSKGYVARVWDDRVVRGQLESLARTTNGTHKINQSMIQSIELPLPPISLQQRFDQAEQATSAHRLRLECAAERLESLFATLQQRAFLGEL